MANDNTQRIEVDMGPLWKILLIVWIILGIIMLLVIVLAVVASAVVLPKLMAGLGAIGALTNMGGGSNGGSHNSGYNNGGYSGNNMNGNYGSNNSNSAQVYFEGLATQLHTYIDEGNWDAARNELNTINSTLSLVPSSQLPAGLTQGLAVIGQAISNRNRTQADAVFSMLNQSGG